MDPESVRAIVRGAVKKAALQLLPSEQIRLTENLSGALSQIRQEERAGPRRRTTRRHPSVDRALAHQWSDFLATINRYRQDILKAFSEIPPIEGALGVDIVPRTLSDLDSACHRLVGLWAKAPNRDLSAVGTGLPEAQCLEPTFFLAVADALNNPPSGRLTLWSLMLVGTLEAFRKEAGFAVAVTSILPPGSPIPRNPVPPGREPADEFLAWWAVPRNLAKTFGEDETAVLCVAVSNEPFRLLPDAPERIRRCVYPPCAGFFLDRSPAFRSAPARGCNKSHTTMAARLRPKLRAQG